MRLCHHTGNINYIVSLIYKYSIIIHMTEYQAFVNGMVPTNANSKVKIYVYI
jgi:hypothetical protein